MADDMYVTGSDPYIDPDTGILRNKLGITTQAQLDAAEADIVTTEIVHLTIDRVPALSAVDISILKDIHRQLFGEIYEWAGEIRTIGISKDSTKFCEPQYIEQEGRRIFDVLLVEDILATISDHSLYINRLAYYYSELNLLHPFREGNGRTLRTFMSILAMNSGGNIIAWDQMDPQENVDACAYAVFYDESKIEAMLAKIIDFG